MSGPVLAGTVPEDGVHSVLAEIEQRRTSGELRFDAKDVHGALTLVAGQLAEDQPTTPDGSSLLEEFLLLKEGRYEVWQRLPVLPVSQGDDRCRQGSLSVHVPADLMNYCERAGLTGMLRLEKDARFAEVVYDAGDLVAIRIDGTDDDALHEVFGWEEGAFSVEAHAERPTLDEVAFDIEPEKAGEPAEDPGQNFLRVVEVALESIVEEREKRRSPSRTGPPLPPPPRTRDSDRPDAPRRDPTVRIIYLGDVADRSVAPDDGRTRHVQRGALSEAPLVDAVPGRRTPVGAAPDRTAPSANELSPAPGRRPISSRREMATGPDAPAKGPDMNRPSPSLAGQLLSASGWLLVLLFVASLALAVLAQLPPL